MPTKTTNVIIHPQGDLPDLPESVRRGGRMDVAEWGAPGGLEDEGRGFMRYVSVDQQTY